jgi:hypothetical protein
MINAKETVVRWHYAPEQDPEDWDDQILKMQKKFKAFKYSIYMLNRVRYYTSIKVTFNSQNSRYNILFRTLLSSNMLITNI